jgi:uncharacterized protein (DUF58 family)
MSTGTLAVPDAPVASVRFVPGRRLALFSLCALPLYAFGGAGALAGVLFNALLFAAALCEARALRASLPHLQRRFDARLLVGVASEVSIRVHNGSGRRLSLIVRDDCPSELIDESIDERHDELRAELEAHARHELRYRIVPARRGRFAFGALHVRVEGASSLGAVIASYEAAQSAQVYPSLRGPRRYELALRLHSLRSVGVRALRRPGGGGEFEQLREYVPGDPYRDLDWKATAKRLRPVTRVHGQEQSQTVVVALDAGRMMATGLDRLSKLDHAIHAALLLAYVALRGGDKVGLIVFAEDVKHFVPPRRGHGQYRRILEALSSVEASQTYVDFRRFSELVRARLPRRALLVIFSDLLDESQAMPLAEQAPLLRRKHLPVCVSMTDPVAEELAYARVQSSEQAYGRAAAASLLEDRETIKAHLRKSGVGLVQAPAAELAIATVNRYLEIKARHAL